MKVNLDGFPFERNSLPVSHICAIYIHTFRCFLKIIIIFPASCNSLLIVSISSLSSFVIAVMRIVIYCHHSLWPPSSSSSLTLNETPLDVWQWQEILHGAPCWVDDPPSLALPTWNFILRFSGEPRGDWIGQCYYSSHRSHLSFPGCNLGWFQNSLQHHDLVTGKPVFQQSPAFTDFFHSHQFIFAGLGNIAKSPLDGGKHCKSLIPKLILQQGTCSGQSSHSANTTRSFFFLKCVLYPAASLSKS